MLSFSKYPSATTLTIFSLGLFLGILHIFLGLISLSPLISHDYHREMKINYNAFAKSLTFIAQFVDKTNLAQCLRYLISISQVLFGLCLLDTGYLHPVGKIGNYALVFVDHFFLFLQLSVGSSYERIAPTIVFALLLITRLIIIEQSAKKTKAGVKTRNAGKHRVATPKKNKNE